jgi:hypothetical protein
MLGLAACAVEDTWYEERCLRLGLKKDTPEFDACISRDVEWIEENRRRGAGGGGP